MALTKGAEYTEVLPGELSLPVKAGEKIFNRALIGVQVGGADDGRVVNWTDALTTATILFLGLAKITAGSKTSQDAKDDFVTGDTAGSVEVGVDARGVILKDVTVTGLSALTNIFDLVYATDEDTFTLTATAGGTPVAMVVRHVTGTTGDVWLFETQAARGFEGR